MLGGDDNPGAGTYKVRKYYDVTSSISFPETPEQETVYPQEETAHEAVHDVDGSRNAPAQGSYYQNDSA